MSLCHKCTRTMIDVLPKLLIQFWNSQTGDGIKEPTALVRCGPKVLKPRSDQFWFVDACELHFGLSTFGFWDRSLSQTVHF